MGNWVLSDLDGMSAKLWDAAEPLMEEAFEAGIRHAFDPEGGAWPFVKDGRLVLHVEDPANFASRDVDLETAALWITTADLTDDEQGQADVRAVGALLKKLGERLLGMPLPPPQTSEAAVVDE